MEYEHDDECQRARLERLEDEVECLKAKTQHIGHLASIKEYRDRIITLEERLDSLEKRHSRFDGRFFNLIKKWESYMAPAQVESSVAFMNKELARARHTADALQQRLNKFDGQMSMQELEANYSQLSKRIDLLTTQIEDILIELTKLSVR